MEKVRTAVVGAGKMGAIHAKVYSQLPASRLIAIVDTDLEKARELAGRFRCQAFADSLDLVGKVDAVTIATPTISHAAVAEILLNNNIAVMIEKPLAATVEEGRGIVGLAGQRGVVAAVGHSERCNPVVQAMKRLNIEPKFIEASRVSPFPFRSMDVGVVLDVMIHDIDIILSLAASEVADVDAIGVGVIDESKEDICNARLRFASGCIANITASRLALKTERKVRVFSRQAYLSLDYLKKTGTIIKASPNVDVVRRIRELSAGGRSSLLKLDWLKLVHVEHIEIDDREPLRVEQEMFLKAVMDKSCRPEVTAEEGLAAMECAERILACVRKHKWD